MVTAFHLCRQLAEAEACVVRSVLSKRRKRSRLSYAIVAELKKLGDEYVAAGEVLTQLDDPLSVTDMNEDDFHFPEKEGEAFVFSPGMKIYVLESEKQAPTHLYVQTASDQYVYLFPSLAEIAPAGNND